MPQDGLNPIVQKMIDAGESEDNIATVIKHYKAQAPRTDVKPIDPNITQVDFYYRIQDRLAQRPTFGHDRRDMAARLLVGRLHSNCQGQSFCSGKMW